MQQLDFTVAEHARDLGMMMSEEKANRDYENWSLEALEHLKNFLIERETPFLTEEVRVYAHANGLPEPQSLTAWGSVIIKAKRQGWIEFAGFSLTSNPKAHRTPATVWKKI